MDENKKIYNVTVSPLLDSQVEIKGEISVDTLNRHRTQALKNINERMELSGFRKGHIPETVLVSRVGEMGILEEVADLALKEAYPQILGEQNIDAIGRPEVTITSMAPGNPLKFTAKTAIMPVIPLPDYLTIAKKALTSKEDAAVAPEEVENAIRQLRQAIATTNPKKETDEIKTEPNGGAPGESEKKEVELPELTDELVKKIGGFEDVEDFKNKLTEQIRREKELRAKEKKRAEIAEQMVEKTTATLPPIIIESELDSMVAQFKRDIERTNKAHEGSEALSLDGYLKHVGKTEESLRGEWRSEAEKRAKLQLILNTIAKAENLTPPGKALEETVERVMQANPRADRESVLIHIAMLLTNDRVFDFLEKQA